MLLNIFIDLQQNNAHHSIVDVQCDITHIANIVLISLPQKKTSHGVRKCLPPRVPINSFAHMQFEFIQEFKQATWSGTVIVVVNVVPIYFKWKINVTLISPGFRVDPALVGTWFIVVHTTTGRVFFTNSLAIFWAWPCCPTWTNQAMVGDFHPVRFI